MDSVDILTRRFKGLEGYPNLVQEVFILSRSNVEIAAQQLIAMGFKEAKAREPTFVTEEVKAAVKEVEPVVSHSAPAPAKHDLPQVARRALAADPVQPIKPAKPAQLAAPLQQGTQPSPIPVSAPIPIPAPTKSQPSTNLNRGAYNPPPPSPASIRGDAQKVVGNLKFVGECIKKNCKRTIKELMQYDKTESMEYIARIKKDDSMTVSVSEILRREFEDIESERDLLEIEKQKFEQEKSRFLKDVTRFNTYVQKEYKALVTSQQLLLSTMGEYYRGPKKSDSYFEESLQDITARLAERNNLNKSTCGGGEEEEEEEGGDNNDDDEEEKEGNSGGEGINVWLEPRRDSTGQYYIAMCDQ